MTSSVMLYIALAFMAFLVIVLLLHSLILRSKISTLEKRYKYFMTADNGTSLERQLAVEVKELREMSRSSEDMLRQHEMLSHMQVQSFQRSGLVKYDAFDDAGDKLSFSLTLLDGANHGFVLTSLVGRETSRIYIKQIMNGQCKEAISAEEAESISKAMAGYIPAEEAETKAADKAAQNRVKAPEEKVRKEAV